MQMGKELTAAAKAEEEQKLKRAADVRRREKEEAEVARAKIQAKLDEDRCGLLQALTSYAKLFGQPRGALPGGSSQDIQIIKAPPASLERHDTTSSDHCLTH